jgi:hypothetical protein
MMMGEDVGHSNLELPASQRRQRNMRDGPWNDNMHNPKRQMTAHTTNPIPQCGY